MVSELFEVACGKTTTGFISAGYESVASGEFGGAGRVIERPWRENEEERQDERAMASEVSKPPSGKHSGHSTPLPTAR
jgi:hypothetical protein